MRGQLYCEYQWELLLLDAQVNGLQSHGESAEGAQNWTKIDPNNPDSDGDSLPDGWEARYACVWDASNVGINPLNGSDYFNNPDGDGYDTNHDGELTEDEWFNNWMEYHIKDKQIIGNMTDDGTPLPDGFETSLWNESWTSGATLPFGDSAGSNAISNVPGIIPTDEGSSDPLSADSDTDGMTDGWELWYARWDT